MSNFDLLSVTVSNVTAKYLSTVLSLNGIKVISVEMGDMEVDPSIELGQLSDGSELSVQIGVDQIYSLNFHNKQTSTLTTHWFGYDTPELIAQIKTLNLSN